MKRDLASVIIPCLNGLSDTRRCLLSLRRRTRHPYEVIVIDNGSSDGTSGYVRSLKDPAIKLIRNPRNLGFAAAINQGMAAARGQYFVWLNNDTVVTEGWLERLVACAERHARTGAVGPMTNRAGAPAQRIPGVSEDPKRAEYTAQALLLKNAGKSSRAALVDGFCFLVKRDAARRAGRLDEDYGVGLSEDYDYCLRLRQAGYTIRVAQDVYVHHRLHATFRRQKMNLRAMAEKNRALFALKWRHKIKKLWRGRKIDPYLALHLSTTS